MSEPPSNDLERHLRAAGTALQTRLGHVDLASGVMETIRAGRSVASVQPTPRRPRRLALLVTLGLVLSATTAWAVNRLVFDGGAVSVHGGPAPRLAPREGSSLHLGVPVSLEEARTLKTFALPDVAWLPERPAMWLNRRANDQFSLVYPPGRSIPLSDAPGVGLLIQSFEGDGNEVIRKYLTNGTDVETVQVNGNDAVYLHGTEHALFVLEPDGHYTQSPGRLAGNAMIFRAGSLTIRIEGSLSAERMLDIANSMSGSRR